jgi:hypothetical protein
MGQALGSIDREDYNTGDAYPENFASEQQYDSRIRSSSKPVNQLDYLSP